MVQRGLKRDMTTTVPQSPPIMQSRKVVRNIFSSWGGYAVTLFVGFWLAPFVLHHLGKEGYGIWTLVISLTGYFGILDLGLRSSVGRFVARYMVLNDPENVNRTISTSLVMLSGAGLLALLATAVLIFNFTIFKVDHT